LGAAFAGGVELLALGAAGGGVGVFFMGGADEVFEGTEFLTWVPALAGTRVFFTGTAAFLGGATTFFTGAAAFFAGAAAFFAGAGFAGAFLATGLARAFFAGAGFAGAFLATGLAGAFFTTALAGAGLAAFLTGALEGAFPFFTGTFLVVAIVTSFFGDHYS
jgi:hypothetical protein